MSRKKKADTGFDVLNDSQDADSGSQVADADVFGDGLDILAGETPTEAPVASDEVSEDSEETKPEPSPRVEKTHERVARIAVEMNTKGYGL